MTTITDFLLARIAEDEGAAREWYGTGTVADRRDDFWLAECEAKRRIVMSCSEMQMSGVELAAYLATQTIRTLALVYADHPDFRPEWR